MERTEELKGITYSIGTLDAFEQLHVARRLAPLLSDLIQVFASSSSLLAGDDLEMKVLELASGPLADAFSKMSDEDVDYITHKCLSVCQRKQTSGWAKVFVKGGGLVFQDIKLDTLLGLTWFVIQENLSSFFPTGQPT